MLCFFLVRVLRLFSVLLLVCLTLGVGEVSMLVHTHSRKPPRKINWPYAITRLTAHFTWDLMSDLMICKHRKQNG